MVVDINVFILSTSVITLRSCTLMVHNAVHGKDNKMEETMGVGDIMMNRFSWNVLQ